MMLRSYAQLWTYSQEDVRLTYNISILLLNLDVLLNLQASLTRDIAKTLEIEMRTLRMDTEDDNSEWLPDQFPELKTSERFLVALLSEQEEVLQKLSSNGYQDQKHWVCML